MGSRSLQQGGAAVLHASQLVAEQAKQQAAEVLEADAPTSCSTSSGGCSTSRGTPAKTATWAEVAAAAGAAGAPLASTTCSVPVPTYPFGAHVAVVEVDTETGRGRLMRHVACDDAGTVLNPLLVEGQVHGGIAQGAAQALFEEVRYDEDGNPITSNFADYSFIVRRRAAELRAGAAGDADAVNPLGAKGIGESGTIGSTPAMQSAVVDALVSPRGAPHRDAGDPETVWRRSRQRKLEQRRALGCMMTSS